MNGKSMPGSYQAVVHSIHKATEGGHGGNRRLLQLVELLAQSASRVTCSQDAFGGTLVHNLQSIATGALYSAGDVRGKFSSLRALRNVGVAHKLPDWTQIGPNSLIVLDSFLRGYEPIFSKLKAKGGKIAIFPQNLDSLTPGSIDPLTSKRSPEWFQNELGVLRKADLIGCLSREDQWLLSLYDIPSLYFPYYPTQSARKELDELRTLRAGSDKDRFVILGSAVNTPTMAGMQELLEHSAALTTAAGVTEVVLVGFGTERLKSADASGRIRVLGGVDNSVLREQLVRARAVICCQAGTTGALTRIPELLRAGIPVIAKYTAARSYYHLDGMYVAETTGHLCQLVRDFPSRECVIPEPPVEYERSVLSAIEGLWSGSV